jgi:hypothetical protein
MKIQYISYLFLSINVYFLATIVEDLKAHDKNFINRLYKRDRELQKLSEECYENCNEDACKKIIQEKKALKEDVSTHAQDPESLEFLMVTALFIHAHLNREKLYRDSEEHILESYKAKVSEEAYVLLKKFEHELQQFNQECFIKKDKQACKALWEPDPKNGLKCNVDEFEKFMKELKLKDEAAYNTVVLFLCDAMVEARINTKKRSYKTMQEYLQFLENFKEIENVNRRLRMLKEEEEK